MSVVEEVVEFAFYLGWVHGYEVTDMRCPPGVYVISVCEVEISKQMLNFTTLILVGSKKHYAHLIITYQGWDV